MTITTTITIILTIWIALSVGFTYLYSKLKSNKQHNNTNTTGHTPEHLNCRCVDHYIDTTASTNTTTKNHYVYQGPNYDTQIELAYRKKQAQIAELLVQMRENSTVTVDEDGYLYCSFRLPYSYPFVWRVYIPFDSVDVAWDIYRQDRAAAAKLWEILYK